MFGAPSIVPQVGRGYSHPGFITTTSEELRLESYVLALTMDRSRDSLMGRYPQKEECALFPDWN